LPHNASQGDPAQAPAHARTVRCPAERRAFSLQCSVRCSFMFEYAPLTQASDGSWCEMFVIAQVPREIS
ncbi:hypothetical protein, partial [Luteibacter sp.]|uniref:hypothetical protein n=1 Tax=Luteibacter sp. TaxID=1886636 RepID=UPI003F7EACE9